MEKTGLCDTHLEKTGLCDTHSEKTGLCDTQWRKLGCVTHIWRKLGGVTHIWRKLGGVTHIRRKLGCVTHFRRKMGCVTHIWRKLSWVTHIWRKLGCVEKARLVWHTCARTHARTEKTLSTWCFTIVKHKKGKDYLPMLTACFMTLPDYINKKCLVASGIVGYNLWPSNHHVRFSFTSRRWKKNKAGYTATEVACRWAGAIFEVIRPFGQEQWGRRNKIIKKAGCRVACTRLKR